MSGHRFEIGEFVTYSEKRFPIGIWTTTLVVVEQLTRGDGPEYRLQANGGLGEYVLPEDQLSPPHYEQGLQVSGAPQHPNSQGPY